MKILLTRLDRVGDLVLSTPAIASVRRSWPQAHVTLACSRYNAVVVARNPDIDRLAVLEQNADPYRFGAELSGEVDLALALAPRTLDFRVVGASRARRRIGYTYVRRYATRLFARRFLTELAISEADPTLAERGASYPVRHEVDQILELVRRAGGSVLSRDLVVPIDDADRAAVAAVPAGALAVQLAPRWLQQGSTLASALQLFRDLRELGRPLLATYGADAREFAAQVRAAGVADVVLGELAFGAWAAAFEKSAAILTVDTGATHVASAARRPTVVLFEHQYYNLNSQEWSPYRVPAVCLRKPAGESAAELAASRAEVVAAVASLLN